MVSKTKGELQYVFLSHLGHTARGSSTSTLEIIDANCVVVIIHQKGGDCKGILLLKFLVMMTTHHVI